MRPPRPRQTNIGVGRWDVSLESRWASRMSVADAFFGPVEEGDERSSLSVLAGVKRERGELGDCGLCSAGYWLYVESPMARLEHAGELAFANVYAQGRSTVGELSLTVFGVRPYQWITGKDLMRGLHGSTLWQTVQDPFNELYTEIFEPFKEAPQTPLLRFGWVPQYTFHGPVMDKLPDFSVRAVARQSVAQFANGWSLVSQLWEVDPNLPCRTCPRWERRQRGEQQKYLEKLQYKDEMLRSGWWHPADEIGQGF